MLKMIKVIKLLITNENLIKSDYFNCDIKSLSH